jgi:hypothetical protein
MQAEEAEFSGYARIFCCLLREKSYKRLVSIQIFLELTLRNVGSLCQRKELVMRRSVRSWISGDRDTHPGWPYAESSQARHPA